MSSPNNLNSITINSRHLLITSLLSIKSSAFLMFSFNVLSISWVLKDLRLIITRASATYYHHSWVGLLLKRNVMQFEFWALALATGHITGAGAGGQQSASTWELRWEPLDQIRLELGSQGILSVQYFDPEPSVNWWIIQTIDQAYNCTFNDNWVILLDFMWATWVAEQIVQRLTI